MKRLGVVDLPRRKIFTRLPQLTASTEQGNANLSKYRNSGAPNRSNRPDFPGPDESARAKQKRSLCRVLTLPTDTISHVYRAVDFNDLIVQPDMLLHDHGVCTLWQRRASKNSEDFPGADLTELLDVSPAATRPVTRNRQGPIPDRSLARSA